MTALNITAKTFSIRSSKGETTMKIIKTNIAAFALATAIAFTSAAPALADSASSKAENKLTELQQRMTALEQIKSEIDGFTIKVSYCKKIHKNDKRAHEQRLAELRGRANTEMREISNIRRILIHTVNRNQAARTKLDHLLPNGSGAIVDGSYFRPFFNLRRVVNEALSSKDKDLSGAHTYQCNNTAAKTETAFVAVNPIAEVVLTTDYEEAAFITLPNKFCHRDEKNPWYDAISRQRENANKNEFAAEKLRDRLRELKADIAAKRQKTWKDADAAAKSSKTAAMNNHISQLKLYDAALKKLDAAIKTAIADIARWKALSLKLQSQYAALTAAPIVDCLKADLSPLDTLTVSGYDGLPESIPAVTLEGMEVKDVEFINIPAHVCEEEMKRSFEMNADQQNSNAYANITLWSERLEKIRVELLRLENAGKTSSDLYKKLTFARREARDEHAKWEKIQLKTKAIVEKAYALKVIDCSQVGGKTEIGRMDPGFEEIADHIHRPDLQAYDLPAIPAKICSWEELQALRARAAKAREVSAHNRQEWGKRLTQLGKLLFNGQPGSAYPMNAEYAAYLDAQRQYDYWSAQQGVSHKVYWDLMQRKNVDCTKADKKVSLNDALQNARNDAPAFASGQNSGFGGFGDASFERDCLLNKGGCFYPNPRNDWMIDRSGGFDGSEAQNALHNTLQGVDVKPKQDDYKDHPQQPQSHPKTPAHDHSDGKPCPEHGITGKTATGTIPSVEKTPAKSEPVPVPYPNASMASDTDKGTTKVKVSSPPAKTPAADPKPTIVTTRNTQNTITAPSPAAETQEPVKQISVETPETLDKRNVTLAPSAGGQMTPLQGPPLVLNETATSAKNAGKTGGYGAPETTAETGAQNGGMIQIAPPPRVYVPHTREPNTNGQFVQTAPPTLVITPQGGSAADRPTPAEQQQLELETGPN